MSSLRSTPRFLLALSLLLTSFGISQAQDEGSESFKQRFTDANYHIEFENYDLAIPIFQELLKEEPDNANLNYKTGYSIIMSNKSKRNAIPYLEKAVENTSFNYDDLNPFEKNAPVAAWYYLGIAYHVGNELDKATTAFNKFKEAAGKKHYLIPEADHSIEQVLYAKELMKTPINVIINHISDSINTPFPEYSPVISIDESTLIFTSRRDNTTGGERDLDGQYFEDIYISEKKDDGTWGTPRHIGPNINTTDHEATIGLSADGQTLFIYKGEEGGSIHMSELVGEEWSVPTRLGSDINSEDWETHAALSADGRILYFTSNRPGGLGGRDIWLVKKLPNGMWAKAQNAGPVINTKYDEEAPFLHPDGKQLFFSSKGHKSMGGFDIFFTEMQEDGKWNTPINIGYPINTTDDDVFYVTSADGTRAYFSSIRESGMGEKDIFLITLPDAIEKAITVLVGYIRTTSGEQLPRTTVVTVTNTETGEILEHRPNSATGKYVLALTPGNYRLSYQAEGTEFYTEDIFVPAESSYQRINKELVLDLVTMGVAPADSGAVVVKDPVLPKDTSTVVIPVDTDTAAVTPKDNVIRPVRPFNTEFQEFFTYNNNRINTDRPEWKAFIDSSAAHVQRFGEVRIAVASSASKVPTRTWGNNDKLAKARAATAKELVIAALKAKGVDASKIKFVSTSSLVLGPPYAGDPQNHQKYEKFQYVKLTTK